MLVSVCFFLSEVGELKIFLRLSPEGRQEAEEFYLLRLFCREGMEVVFFVFFHVFLAKISTVRSQGSKLSSPGTNYSLRQAHGVRNAWP